MAQDNGPFEYRVPGNPERTLLSESKSVQELRGPGEGGSGEGEGPYCSSITPNNQGRS